MVQHSKRIFKRLQDFHHRHEYVSLSAVLLVFSGLALGNITRWSIWFDEAFSAYLMRFDLIELTRFVAVDVHPPLYFWLLKGWTSIFGVSELAFRSLSVVFALCALTGGYMLVRSLFTKNAALIATTIAALSPLLLRFADEARMYTLITAIVLWATWLLVRLQKQPSRRGWAMYAILLAAGMYTHYFAAFAWLAHWVWRFVETRSNKKDRFWTKEWILAHVGAIALYGPWLVPAVLQFITVQSGFWIPPISAYTPVDYLSNSMLYLTYGAVQGWWAVLFWVAIITAGVTTYAAFKLANKKQKSGLRLLLSMSSVPPLLMLLVSLPPLKSAFIDRYVLYAAVSLLLLVGVSLSIVWHKRTRVALVASLSLAMCLIVGIGYVYYYGNYNKNSNVSIRAREAVVLAQESNNTHPIITASPWLYYEASFYETNEFPVYYLDSSTEYEYGSLAMLRDSEKGKIRDIDAFTEENRYVWYLDTYVDRDPQPPAEGWREVETRSAYDGITNQHLYHITLYDTQAAIAE